MGSSFICNGLLYSLSLTIQILNKAILANQVTVQVPYKIYVDKF